MTAIIHAVLRRARHRAGAALVLTVIAGTMSVSAAQASCMPLDLASVPDAPGRVVVAGTVLDVSPAGTLLEVERWWGAEPRDVITIVGGRGSADPGVETSVDWTPRPGEAWLVVGQRQADLAIRTEACQQTDARPSTLESARAAFGPPQEPPFAPGPGPSDPEQPLPVALILVGGGALIVLLTPSVLLVLRRPRSNPPPSLTGSHERR